jgi:hypothetical protein
MANYIIVGGGAAGLYTAYRLLQSGNLIPGADTVTLYEWSDRVGGRIYSYTFPPNVSTDGLYAEVGGMRFAIDSNNFPNNPSQIIEGHVLVQNMILEMELQGKVVPFLESPVMKGQPKSGRMYYLRGDNFYENSLTDPKQLPYNFNSEFDAFLQSYVKQPPYTADAILAGLATAFVPSAWGSNVYRPQWCNYYATGTVSSAAGTTSFPPNTLISDIGYWNLLYDQLGDEGFDYTADGNGYTSNVINWNSADAMQANNDYGSGVSYSRLLGGYSLLFDALSNAIAQLSTNFIGSGIMTGQRLLSLAENSLNQTVCVFADSNGNTTEVNADYLFLAMPRRSIEMVAANCPPTHILNNESVKFYLESSIDQPAIKVVMVFDTPWWQSAPVPPNLQDDPVAGPVGGPTITDLPLRQVYYFGSNVPGPTPVPGGPFVLLASYDDMSYSDFWRQLEIQGTWPETPSEWRQPLIGPTSVPIDSPFTNLLLKQLGEAHGLPAGQLPPVPIAVYFQDWGQDPFGGGYHGWAPHYNICNAMDWVRAPYQKILRQSESSPQLYIVGSCYSFDQAWVEGAFCTAESVLQEFLGLPAFRSVSDYTLICTVPCS